MQVGMVGLGRMGANMVRRLICKGHSCVVFNRSPKAVNELVKDRAIGAASRTAGRDRISGTAEQGYLHCGPNGGSVASGKRNRFVAAGSDSQRAAAGPEPFYVCRPGLRLWRGALDD